MVTTRSRVFDALTFSFLALAAYLYAFGFDARKFHELLDVTLVAGALLIVGFVISWFLQQRGILTLGAKVFGPPQLTAKIGKFWQWQLGITLLLSLVLGLIKTQFSFNELTDADGFAGAIRLFQGLAHPNLDLLPRALINIVETMFMAFLATAFAIPFAFILSFLCAKNIMQHPVAVGVYVTLRTLLNVTRSIEALIWAIIFSVWVGIGPFAGMLALMIHSVASLAKQYSEMVESISEGPIEGIRATGANPLQVIWFAVVPQVVLPYISFTVYRWDINIRMATIIGLVGGGGIGTMLIQYQGQAMWPEVGCIVLVIAVVVWMMDQASAFIREALK